MPPWNEAGHEVEPFWFGARLTGLSMRKQAVARPTSDTELFNCLIESDNEPSFRKNFVLVLFKTFLKRKKSKMCVNQNVGIDQVLPPPRVWPICVSFSLGHRAFWSVFLKMSLENYVLLRLITVLCSVKKMPGLRSRVPKHCLPSLNLPRSW